MPAFSSRRIAQLEESITGIVDGMLNRIEANGPEFDGMKDYGAHLVVDALLTAMVAMDERRKQSCARGGAARIRQARGVYISAGKYLSLRPRWSSDHGMSGCSDVGNDQQARHVGRIEDAVSAGARPPPLGNPSFLRTRLRVRGRPGNRPVFAPRLWFHAVDHSVHVRAMSNATASGLFVFASLVAITAAALTVRAYLRRRASSE
jgi:hypothetical protein